MIESSHERLAIKSNVIMSVTVLCRDNGHLQEGFSPISFLGFHFFTRGGGSTPLCGLHSASPKGMVLMPFWSEIGYRFWSFWSQMGYGFCTLVLNWDKRKLIGYAFFFRRSCFSALSTRPSTKVLHNDRSELLKQGTDFRVRS